MNNTFLGFAAPEPGPGVYGMAGIFNPADSGVDIIVERIAPWSSGFAGFVLNQWDALGANVLGGQNKRRTTPNHNQDQPKAKVYWHLSSVAVGTGLTEYYTPTGEENGTMILLSSPLILTPGTGIYVTSNPGVSISVQYEWREEPVL